MKRVTYIPVVNHRQMVRSDEDASVRKRVNNREQIRVECLQVAQRSDTHLVACETSTNVVEKLGINLRSVKLWREELECRIVVHRLIVESTCSHSAPIKPVLSPI